MGILIDIILIAGALALIVAPKWTYNFGRKEAVEMPKNWHIISRVIGVVFLCIEGVFLYLQYGR